MVAFNRVRCTVIAVSQLDNACLSRGAIAREVLPWADPYIASLFENEDLQADSEVAVLNDDRFAIRETRYGL